MFSLVQLNQKIFGYMYFYVFLWDFWAHTTLKFQNDISKLQNFKFKFWKSGWAQLMMIWKIISKRWRIDRYLRRGEIGENARLEKGLILLNVNAYISVICSFEKIDLCWNRWYRSKVDEGVKVDGPEGWKWTVLKVDSNTKWMATDRFLPMLLVREP